MPAGRAPEPGSLDAILQTLRANRTTGCVRVTSGAKQANLYMLFGHLYHAEGPSGVGDTALAEAQSWRPVTVQVDSRAKLPEIETITGS